MAVFTCVFLLICIGLSASIDLEAPLCMKEPNKLDDISFVSPEPGSSDPYPTTIMFCMEGRYQIIKCCGTGFDTINWYYNGKFIDINDARFDFEEQRQTLHWKKAFPAGLNPFSCELVKNTNITLRHDMSVNVVEDPRKNCVVTRPYYTILPKPQCASPGDNVSVECEIFYGDDKCTNPFFKRVQFFDTDDTFISTEHADYKNVKVKSVNRDSRATSVLATLTFYNVTEKQLNTTFYCVARRHDYLKVNFGFLGQCKEQVNKSIKEVEYFDNGLSMNISIPVLASVCVLVIVGALLYLYRRELKLLWNTYIKPAQKGCRAYDGYVICSKDERDQKFLLNHLIEPTEKYYKLCIPDRDFLIGSVIPVTITDYLRNSKRVLVITSTNMLQTDYCDLALSLAITNKVPLIFLKHDLNETTNESEQFAELISERPEISSAISVSPVLTFPKDSSNEQQKKEFYNSLYSAMPFANKNKGQSSDGEKLHDGFV